MSIVVGIDPSLTSTGIAVLVDGQPRNLRTIGHHTPNSKTYAHRSDRIVSQTRAIIRHIEDICMPDLAVIEGPAYANANAYTHDQSGLWWGIYSALRARKTPTVVIAPKTRALWVTGNGNADKRQVLDTVRNWYPGHHVAGHDIADAAALALAGAFHLDDPMPFDVEPEHHNRLKAVVWPSVSCAKP
jgi:Holliday junction resolvasome RuvABC endonuclease subunit